MNEMHKSRLKLALPLFALLVAGDLLSKYWMSHHMVLGESKPVIPHFLSFTLVHNYGAAFGVGQRWSMIFFIVVSIAAIGAVGHFMWKLKPEEKLSYWGLVFILSGAIGNLTDRFRLGYVVDFIDVYHKNFHWWVFNLADSWITIGAILFGIEMLIKKPKVAA